MKITEDIVNELATRLARAICDELDSEYEPALLLHERDAAMFVKIIDLIQHRNPIEGETLTNIRKGLNLIWEHSKVLSGRDMGMLARALDVGERHDNNIKASEDSIYANAY